MGRETADEAPLIGLLKGNFPRPIRDQTSCPEARRATRRKPAMIAFGIESPGSIPKRGPPHH
jgi:hypothetical protein